MKYKFVDWIALLLVFSHFLMLAPTAFVASQSYSELAAVSADQPQIVMMFFDILAGRPPAYCPYGLSLCFLVAMFMAPIALILGIFGYSVPFSAYVVTLKLAQIALASGCLAWLYLLVRRASGGWWGLLAVCLVSGTYALNFWSVILKPDIWMLFFILGSCYFLGEALLAQKPPNAHKGRHLLYSAVFWGLSVGSKIWTIFFAPVVLLVLYFYFQALPKRNRTKIFINHLVAACLGFIIAIAVSMPHFFYRYREMREVFGRAGESVNSTPLGISFKLLFWNKVQTLTSWQFGGPWIFTAFFFITLFLFIKWAVDKKRKSYIPTTLRPLFMFVVVFLAYTFIFAKDTYNIYGGERNVLAIVVPMVAIVASFLSSVCSDQTYVIRAIGKGLVGAFLVLTVLAWTTGYVVDWLPIPQLIHEEVFKTTARKLSEADRQELYSYYEENAYPHQKVIRSDLSPSDLQRVHNLLAQGEIYKPISFVVQPYAKPSFFIKSILNTPNKPEFKVRDWFREEGSGGLILTEYYVNLLQNECYTPMDDLLGYQIQRVHQDKMAVTASEIESFQPKFLVTRYKFIADDIVREFPFYELAKNFEDKVWVLRKIETKK